MTVGQGKGPFRFKNTGRKVKITEKKEILTISGVRVKQNDGRAVVHGENER